ncbi:CAP domain-containing protein [Nonomuraea sp. B12E4]|uniref:CAP domain-containing protein n=1 Tax=Nonomuraea sp. B12E4 TaxID=3153564 RepID=UPI00325D5F39
MRRPLGALAGLVSLAAVCTPLSPAQAATAAETAAAAPAAPAALAAACRVSVAKPRLSTALKIQSFAVRRGCFRPALMRIRILRAVPGPDRVVKSGAGRKGRITLAIPCRRGTYYAVATDYRGNSVKSKPVKLSCAPGRGTTTPAPTPSPSTPPPASGTAGTAEENEVVRLTNAERAKGGCRSLAHDPRLRAAAAGHSTDMARNGFFDHDSQDGRGFLDRIRAAGFTGGSSWAENIAAGQPTPASVVRAWMNSPGHRTNIMNCRFNLIGVGAVKDARGRIYWTQDFAAR